MWIYSVKQHDYINSRYISAFRIEEDSLHKWNVIVTPVRGREIVASIHEDEESARQAMGILLNRIQSEFKKYVQQRQSLNKEQK